MPTVLELVETCQRSLESADLFYGHGTDNPADEALFLVLHGLGLDYDVSDDALNARCSDEAIAKVDSLVNRRITERLPSAYLTHRMWFAGLEFYVDERVLVPRSPLAELILRGFSPWLDHSKVARILEVGTGSGCIAIALARQFPDAEIIATDISPAALEVAAINQRRHSEIATRLTFIEADLFPDTSDNFDLIVTNPPYVPENYFEDLPQEFHAEPKLALAAGNDGLSFIHDIFLRCPDRLSPEGLMFFDVGDRWQLIEQTYPSVRFTWSELEYGGEGIGMVDRAALSTLQQTQVK